MRAVRYITSKIDNINYCLTNGQFARHLRAYNYTYQQYYEQYITGIVETCKYCGNSKKFYQTSHTYAATCGKPECRGYVIKDTKNSWTDEQRAADSASKNRVNALRTAEQKQKILEKVKATNLEKFGTEFSFQSDEIKAKAVQTKLQRYGNENYNNSRKASESRINRSSDDKRESASKRRLTNLTRYGVENSLLLNNGASKSNKSNSLVKTYTLPSGKQIGIRGYEPFVLDKLLKIYNEDDIIVHDNFSKTVVETIDYIAVNRHHLKYYPDIYIKPINTIIEVKSEWWWNGNGDSKYNSRFENNLRKRSAALAKGYIYEVWLFKNKYDYRIIRNDSDI